MNNSDENRDMQESNSTHPDAESSSAELDINKIPMPIPPSGDTKNDQVDAPLTDDTIAIKKQGTIPEKETPISFSDEPENNQTASSEELGEGGDETPQEPETNASKPDRKLKIFCYSCNQKLDLTHIEAFSTVECPSCSNNIIVPKWWDNYLLEELCGVGGMAKVYRGLDLALDREVAIKILNDDISNDANKNKLFLHEARTAATLNHYAILPIYTCGEYEGKAYFVMQYMGGGSLDKEIQERGKDNPIKISEATKWLRDICEGLDNARRHGIVHHDIKPGNFMLDTDGNVKIGDFGISQAIYDSQADDIAELTRNWGSPEYVSPEKGTTGKETYLGDIYSLGASFYHILTGELPFDNQDVQVLLKAKTVKDPIDIRKLRAGIPDSLAELIMSMMNRTPEARPSYRDIIVELNAINKSPAPGGKRTISATGTNFQKTVPAPVRKVNLKKADMSSFDPSKYGVKQSNPIVSLIKTVVVLGVLGYGVYYLYSNGYLSGILPDSTTLQADYFPDISKFISSGDTVKAAKLAEKKLNTPMLNKDELKQAALQLALLTYLNNTEKPDSKCSFIAERLLSAGIPADAPELTVLKFLSVTSITPEALRKQLGNDKDLQLVGEIAVFVRGMYMNASKKDKLEALKKYADISGAVPENYWGLAWGDRIQTWYDWVAKKKGDQNALEPLMRRTDTGIVMMKEGGGASSALPQNSINIDDLNAESLEEARSFAFLRPQPKDFTIKPEELKSYLAEVDAKYKDIEAKRGKIVSDLKMELCKQMLKKPYKGTLALETGAELSGAMIGNKRGIIVRSPGEPPEKHQWDELSSDQVIDLLAHYASLLESTDSSKAAEEYLKLAVFADWYGNYEKAAEFAKKAIELDGSIKNRVLSLFQ